jgi:starch synthase
MYAIKKALGAKADFSLWKKVVRNAMESDYSWRESAREYMELYKRLLKK